MGRTVKSQTALIFGLGYTAKALIPHLRDAGYEIIATSRTAENLAFGQNIPGVQMISFSGHVRPSLTQAIATANLIISSIPPADDGSDPVLSAIPKLPMMARSCHWAGYLSATSVYGDRQGRWAFEDELLYPATQRGRNRIQAELAWLESRLPVHIFRLAGIYGPALGDQSRNAFRRLQNSQVKAIVKPGHMVNRIHVFDIASALMASIAKPNPTQVYNIADGHPAAPQEVLDFAADLIGEARPERVDFDKADMSPMARSFYLETKKINNARARSELGWRPQYPTYRDGLCDIYRTQEFGPEAFLLAGHIIVPDEDLEAVRRLLPDHKSATLAEPGCLRFDVFQDLKNKNKFHVFEVFKSEAAFQHHKARMAGVKASANIERFYTVSKAN